MKKFLKLLILIIIVFIFWIPPAFADIKEEFLIKLKPGVTEQEKKSLMQNAEFEELGNKKIKIYKVKTDKKLKEDLLKSTEVEYVVPNYKRELFLVPNDSYYSEYQWNLPKINMPNTWDITTGNSSIIVAVLDSGIDTYHPDLQGKITLQKNIVTGSTYVTDTDGHGTHVSGIIGAIGNNSEGIAGISWQTKIMPVKVSDSYGYIYDSYVINGIIYAVDNGAKIINISLGGSGYSPAMQDAVDYATTRNVVVVSAVGNDGTTELKYPAACYGVIGVGSTNAQDNKSTFSQYNQSVDVVAPGEAIASTYYYGGYVSGDGTSQAAPHVSGLASLILSVKPSLSASQVVSIIQETSVDFGASGRDDLYGYGRIDAFEAVKKATTPYGAQIIDHTIPTTMTAGLSYPVSITVKNTGSNTWTADDSYRLAALGNSDPFTAARQYLDAADAIATNQTKTFFFTMTAPSTTGIYTTDWQMLREYAAWFGDTLDLQVTVQSNVAPYGAQIIDHTIPTTMTAGLSYPVSITVKNTGSNTWTADDSYRLAALGNSDPFTAARQYLDAADAITTNQTKTFFFTMTAPSTTGIYTTDWQMLREYAAWFGDMLMVQVTVNPVQEEVLKGTISTTEHKPTTELERITKPELTIEPAPTTVIELNF